MEEAGSSLNCRRPVFIQQTRENSFARWLSSATYPSVRPAAKTCCVEEANPRRCLPRSEGRKEWKEDEPDVCCCSFVRQASLPPSLLHSELSLLWLW